MPFQFAMRMKSDHSDLQHTHVWGCPCFVLEAKLQDNHKLPKWNQQACMGQFLSFSWEHSLAVALVQNLHMGLFSPKYHVVFNNKFEMVFHNGKSTEELDKICNELFLISQDCYVEEEYNEDGVLIYKPPPLDKVWLSELEQ